MAYIRSMKQRRRSQRVIELTDWTLTVEDWNEGEKKQMIEDRGKGIVTREVYYETKKTKLEAGKVELKPWKDIPQIGPQVSGVGITHVRWHFLKTGITASGEF